MAQLTANISRDICKCEYNAKIKIKKLGNEKWSNEKRNIQTHIFFNFKLRFLAKKIDI